MELIYLFIFMNLIILLIAKRKMGIQMILIHIGLLLLKIIMMPFIWIISLCKKRKVCPPLNDPLLKKSAKKLAFLIRTGQISSEEVIRAYIARVEEINNIVNAVVENRFEKAISEAKEIDKFIASKQKTEEQIENDTPLLGVPITVKESLAVNGMSNGAGMVHKNKKIANTDAEIVRRCKEAGAIPLLVSNTPELCMYWETFNNVTGRTLNPYDTRRTVGGSSGGEAALLGSGASLLGLGSDICGSLRLPAMFAGVFGHKPTANSVSLEGHVPGCTDKNWSKYFITGPMTRYAEDMPLLFSIISKPELKNILRINEPISMKNLKFFYMENETNPETIAAMKAFVSYLQEKYEITARKVDIKLLKSSFQIGVPQLLSLEEIDSPYYDSTTKKFAIGKELFRYLTFRSNLSFPVILYGLVKKVFSLFSINKVKFTAKLCERLHSEFKELLGENGVLLYPTFTNVAHFHNEIIYKVLDTNYLLIFNALGLPATNCPAGFNAKGLPYGFQVIANQNCDRLTIAVAQEIEKAFGGWKPPNDSTIRINVI